MSDNVRENRWMGICAVSALAFPLMVVLALYNWVIGESTRDVQFIIVVGALCGLMAAFAGIMTAHVAARQAQERQLEVSKAHLTYPW